MNKHTPGPWFARSVGGPAFKNQMLWAIDYNEDQEQVVDFVYEESDAILIAAAPDLLAALLLAQQVIEEKCAVVGHGCVYSAREIMPDVFKVIDGAIARAKGEAV